MSIFSTYMETYYDTRQHQLSRLSHMWEGAREMYSKVNADSRVPQREKVLEEVRLEWADLPQECVAWPLRYMAIKGIKQSSQENGEDACGDLSCPRRSRAVEG